MATITELADSLVREEKISFRQAHEVAQHLSKELILKDIALDEVDFNFFSNLFEQLVGLKPTISREHFKEVCSPRYFVNVRNLPGGPSKDTIINSLEVYKNELSEYKKTISENESFINNSKNNLVKFYKQYS